MRNGFQWRFLCMLINLPLIVGAIFFVIYEWKFYDPMLKNVGPSVIYTAELLALTALTLLANGMMWFYSKNRDRRKFLKYISCTSFSIVVLVLWIDAKFLT